MSFFGTKNKTISFFALVFVIGCNQNSNKQNRNSNTNFKQVEAIDATVKSTDDLQLWKNVISEKDTNALSTLYAANAITILNSGEIISGDTKIVDYYFENVKKIGSSKSLFNINANSEKNINYEIVQFSSPSLHDIIQVLISTIHGGKIVRELELNLEQDSISDQIDITQLNKRRELWMKLCNDNNVRDLVHQMYFKEALYYNHKPIVKGSEELIKEYDYMNNEKYNLTLNPIKITPINKNCVVEIGQCKGSYGGKYILIWKKEFEEEWKIFFDSNY